MSEANWSGDVRPALEIDNLRRRQENSRELGALGGVGKHPRVPSPRASVSVGKSIHPRHDVQQRMKEAYVYPGVERNRLQS